MPRIDDPERRELFAGILAKTESEVARLIRDVEHNRELSCRQHERMEARMHVIERNMYIAIGALAVLQIIMRIS